MQVRLGGAGGARTHDRQIMRSTLVRSMRLTCNDASGRCHKRTPGTGSSRVPGPCPRPHRDLRHDRRRLHIVITRYLNSRPHAAGARGRELMKLTPPRPERRGSREPCGAYYTDVFERYCSRCRERGTVKLRVAVLAVTASALCGCGGHAASSLSPAAEQSAASQAPVNTGQTT